MLHKLRDYAFFLHLFVLKLIIVNVFMREVDLSCMFTFSFPLPILLAARFARRLIFSYFRVAISPSQESPLSGCNVGYPFREFQLFEYKGLDTRCNAGRNGEVAPCVSL